MANEATKACNLTESEIKRLINGHGAGLHLNDDYDAIIERINYLNKRLKAFKEPEETKPALAMDAWGKPTT
jgi:uncharacterized protein YpuA (DUF1002 family)